MPDKMIKIHLACHKMACAEMFKLKLVAFMITVIAVIVELFCSSFLSAALLEIISICLVFIIVQPGSEYYDRKGEVILFEKDEFTVTFNPRHCSNVWQKKCIIKFRDVSSIHYNKDFGLLDIDTLYTVETNDNAGSLHNGSFRLYGYFSNFVEMIKAISSRSGVPITRV